MANGTSLVPVNRRLEEDELGYLTYRLGQNRKYMQTLRANQVLGLEDQPGFSASEIERRREHPVVAGVPGAGGGLLVQRGATGVVALIGSPATQLHERVGTARQVAGGFSRLATRPPCHPT